MKFNVSVMFKHKYDKFPGTITYSVEAATSKEAMDIVIPYACRENRISKRQMKISVKEAV